MDYTKKLAQLIEMLIAQGASDLHLGVGVQPVIRVARALTPVLSEPKLTNDDVMGLLSVMMTPAFKERFLQDQEIDFSYAYGDKVRFRGNAYFERGHVGVALRLIPKTIRTIAELGLPPVLETFTARTQGFFLVVGPIGQGKTTTLAALIEKINQERTEHIITIEDPIEYLYENKKSLIEQREVRIDTKDFDTALRSAFRQDANVIMIGEMRTPETMSAAVSAAETGHLVFSTLHTNDAAQSIDRIIDSFPSSQQDQIRIQLASSLAGIFSQRLVPRISGGLVPVCELLINTPAVANLIREKRTHEIQTVIETSSSEGMIDMSRSLAEMVRMGEITIESAYSRATNPKNLERLL
ncbi:type IV pili twitching motility protein PilT [Candidatus Adlerbacteria bacterium RIFOXYC1_FULL_48_26]|uniref:Type IV pili twitching motility protein PilT n=1 Tax=Candidatus Adlerbacteria bacterium RIFOXYC1_FULL_48_26 TaxID=1797247 RepID=A0A1F4Y2M5_9BACT|nr:MAG: type IV pili twitching motility protein PilT [Candidatus Adlerbacteria bacterium RIFOXYC1_FULL_48_26]OGC93961.1 MAG: type IV pili twitching motility protein PilT [Candidatus Adlerbacteria bacterium RIFOXYB1_FULL_48_10]